MRRVQVSVSHSPEDSTRRKQNCILHIGFQSFAHGDELDGLLETEKEDKNRREGFTQSISSLVPCPSFQLFALCVTADQPSVRFSFASSSHSHIAAFRRSLTEPRESRATTSCEYTRETIRFSVKLVRVASVRDLKSERSQRWEFEWYKAHIRWCKTVYLDSTADRQST